MMSIEMERWRVYFENSGEDLWTVIDWALTVAAVNYPQELRIRRDGYAEKLFAPSNYPLVSSNCEAPTLTGSEVRNVPNPKQEDDHREDEYQRNAASAAARACSYGDAEGEEEQMMSEITGIGKKLEGLDESSQEEDFVRPLQRLKDIKAFYDNKFAVQALRVTGIGKVVNKLRKHHPSKRVRTAATKLVRLWKDVVDELVKTEGEAAAAEIAGSNPNPDEGQNEEGELIEERSKMSQAPAQNRVDLLSSSVSSVTHPSSSQQSMQMLDTGDDDIFGCSPDDARMEPQRSHRTGLPANTPNRLYNAKLNGYRKDSGPFTQPKAENDSRPDYTDYDIKLEARASSNGPVARVTKAPATAPNTTSKKPLSTRPAKPHSPECPSLSEKLEAAKRRLHEGYQQASNVKKQRTVQVMGLEEVPPEGGHSRPGNAKAVVGNGSRRGSQR